MPACSPASRPATGWDPRHADIVVGTSAGSGVGASLRFGMSATDLVARHRGDELSSEGAAIVARLGPTGDWTEPTRPREWRPPHPKLLGRLVRTPWRVRPEALLGVSIPTGRIDTETWTAALRPVTGTAWPGAPAVDLRRPDGRRAPRRVRPVGRTRDRRRHRGRRELGDPGVLRAGHDPWSPLRGRRGALPLQRGRPAHRAARPRPRVVADEHLRQRADPPCDSTRRAATSGPASGWRSAGCAGPAPRSLAFQPSREDLEVMGNRTMDPERVGDVAARALATTIRRLEDAAAPQARPARLRAEITRFRERSDSQVTARTGRRPLRDGPPCPLVLPPCLGRGRREHRGAARLLDALQPRGRLARHPHRDRVAGRAQQQGPVRRRPPREPGDGRTPPAAVRLDDDRPDLAHDERQLGSVHDQDRHPVGREHRDEQRVRLGVGLAAASCARRSRSPGPTCTTSGR